MYFICINCFHRYSYVFTVLKCYIYIYIYVYIYIYYIYIFFFLKNIYQSELNFESLLYFLSVNRKVQEMFDWIFLILERFFSWNFFSNPISFFLMKKSNLVLLNLSNDWIGVVRLYEILWDSSFFDFNQTWYTIKRSSSFSTSIDFSMNLMLNFSIWFAI